MKINIQASWKDFKVEKLEFKVYENDFRGITENGEYVYGDWYILNGDHYIRGDADRKLYPVSIVQEKTPLKHDGQYIYEGDQLLVRYQNFETMLEICLDSFGRPTLYHPGTISWKGGKQTYITAQATTPALVGLKSDRIVEVDDLEIILVVTPQPIKEE